MAEINILIKYQPEGKSSSTRLHYESSKFSLNIGLASWYNDITGSHDSERIMTVKLYNLDFHITIGQECIDDIWSKFATLPELAQLKNTHHKTICKYVFKLAMSKITLKQLVKLTEHKYTEGIEDGKSSLRRELKTLLNMWN